MIKAFDFVLIFCFVLVVAEVFGSSCTTHIVQSSARQEAQALFQYFLDEVALDELMSPEEQLAKVQDYKILAESLPRDHRLTLLE